jgi:hypothetical protein
MPRKTGARFIYIIFCRAARGRPWPFCSTGLSKSCHGSGARLENEQPIMSFFQTILDSIENPNHAGSQQDLSGPCSGTSS